MDVIRQGRPNENPILKLNKRLKLKSLNRKFDTQTHQEIYGLLDLQKKNSVVFLGVNLLAGTHLRG